MAKRLCVFLVTLVIAPPLESQLLCLGVARVLSEWSAVCQPGCQVGAFLLLASVCSLAGRAGFQPAPGGESSQLALETAISIPQDMGGVLGVAGWSQLVCGGLKSRTSRVSRVELQEVTEADLQFVRSLGRREAAGKDRTVQEDLAPEADSESAEPEQRARGKQPKVHVRRKRK